MTISWGFVLFVSISSALCNYQHRNNNNAGYNEIGYKGENNNEDAFNSIEFPADGVNPDFSESRYSGNLNSDFLIRGRQNSGLADFQRNRLFYIPFLGYINPWGLLFLPLIPVAILIWLGIVIIPLGALVVTILTSLLSLIGIGTTGSTSIGRRKRELQSSKPLLEEQIVNYFNKFASSVEKFRHEE